MSVIQVTNEDRGVCLGERIRVADRWWPRLRGFIGRPQPRDGQGLLIRPCRGVHMQWMTYALDIAFLDEEGRVVAVYPELRPWRFSKTHREATAALELPAGALDRTGTEVGDRLSWCERASAAA